jgi:hypothetical protein
MKHIFILLFGLLASSAMMGQAGNFPAKRAGNNIAPLVYRRVVPCASFRKPNYTKDYKEELQHPDSLVLPAGFPKPFPGATQCGCIMSDHEVYYISTDHPYRLFEYYSKKLDAAGFKVQQTYTPAGTNDQAMRFSDAKGSGYIYAYADKAAYSITYLIPDRTCNCGNKKH